MKNRDVHVDLVKVELKTLIVHRLKERSVEFGDFQKN
jgi:hypothetical protein